MSEVLALVIKISQLSKELSATPPDDPDFEILVDLLEEAVDELGNHLRRKQ